MARKSSNSPIHGINPYKPKKSEEYMNQQQIEHFQAILLSWRAELADETSRTVHHMKDETASHPDPNDRASQETGMTLELRERDRDRKLLKNVDDAIVLLNSGEYGYCETCGIEIGLKRLEARPTAKQCIDCKSLDEIREKQLA